MSAPGGSGGGGGGGGGGDEPDPSKKPLSERDRRILRTFRGHVPSEEAPVDENGGLHSLCRVLYENRVIAPYPLLFCIFFLCEMHDVPHYSWSEEELAVLADFCGYDVYIYNRTEDRAVVFGRGSRPAAVLYNEEDNTHWSWGTRTQEPSDSHVPAQFAVVEDVTEVLTVDEVAQRLRAHLITHHAESLRRNRTRYAQIKTALMNRIRWWRSRSSSSWSWDHRVEITGDRSLSRIPQDFKVSIYQFFRNLDGCGPTTMSYLNSVDAAPNDVDEELRIAYEVIAAAWSGFWIQFHEEEEQSETVNEGENEEENNPGPSRVIPDRNDQAVGVVNAHDGKKMKGKIIVMEKRLIPQQSDSEADEDDSTAVQPPTSDLDEDLDEFFEGYSWAFGQQLDSEADDDLDTLEDDEPEANLNLSDDETQEEVCNPALGGAVKLPDRFQEITEDELNTLNKEDPEESDVEVEYGRAFEGESSGRVYVRKRAVPLPSTSDSDVELNGSDGAERDSGQTPRRGPPPDEQDPPMANGIE